MLHVVDSAECTVVPFTLLILFVLLYLVFGRLDGLGCDWRVSMLRRAACAARARHRGILDG